MSASRTLRALALAAVAAALVGLPPWDADADGYRSFGPGPRDCNDRSAAVHPGANDVPLDGVDQDCDGADRAAGSNVVLITIDTLRARNLGIYGYERDTSPHIDALGREGAVFLNAFSSTSWTIPSLASLLTSRHATQHRTLQPRSKLPETLPYLPELLQREGYETATFIQSAYPLLAMGFARGFALLERPANSKTPKILAWLREQAKADERFFLWVHYSEPHTPYTPSPGYDKLFVPESWKDKRDFARYWNSQECMQFYDKDPDAARLRMGFYDARIRESDQHVGEIMAELKRLGIADRTMVILSADHGEEFFEHRGCDHGQTLYDEVLHIPLIIRHPSVVPPGRRVTEQVREIDVMPTILDALELPIPPGVAGQSLLPLARGEGRGRPLLGGFLSNTEQAVVIRHHGMKYVYSPNRTALRQRQQQETEELYDLVADPGERNNLALSGHPRLEYFRRKAKRWVEGPRPPAATEVHFDEATVARLRALGYLAPAPAPPAAPPVSPPSAAPPARAQ
ncbi:MAG TPA: sulfatase-like hydrolase/transferase [Candidatus Limnocylindria bacterium]|nr:sulfatase-like hydrolase/transferase [Candidatus Limnocylindria bacterium]